MSARSASVMSRLSIIISVRIDTSSAASTEPQHLGQVSVLEDERARQLVVVLVERPAGDEDANRVHQSPRSSKVQGFTSSEPRAPEEPVACHRYHAERTFRDAHGRRPGAHRCRRRRHDPAGRRERFRSARGSSTTGRRRRRSRPCARRCPIRDASHEYQDGSGHPDLLTCIAAKLAGENGIDVGRGSRDHGHGRREHGVHARRARDHRARRRNHPAGAVSTSTTRWRFRWPAAARSPSPTDARYQLDLDALAPRHHRAHARHRHHLAEQSERRGASPKRSLREVNALCRDRGLYHICRRDLRVLHLRSGARTSRRVRSRTRPRTRSRCTRCRRPTAWPGGGSATWSTRRHSPAAMLKIQDTILICPTAVSAGARRSRRSTSAGRTASRTSGSSPTFAKSCSPRSERSGRCATCRPRTGAFYCCLGSTRPRCTRCALAERLIREHKVAVIPGTAFGMTEGCYFRVAYGALQKETVAEGIGRLVTGLRAICG